MFCRNCGTELKEGANFCPRCGAPVRNRQQTGTQQNVRMPAGKQKRFGGRKKIVVPVVTAAAVLVVAVGSFAVARTNFFRSRFSSPKDYYRSVEQAYIDRYTERLDRMSESASDGRSVTMDVTLEEAGLALLGIGGYSSQAAVDGLNDLEIRIQSGEKGGLLGMDAGLYSSDGGRLISANAVLDSDSEELYLQVPELSSGYMLMDSDAFNDMGIQSVSDMAETSGNIEDLSAIISTYTEVMLDYTTDVERENTSVSAGGIEQDAILLDVSVSGNQLRDMALDICKTMKEDENLEKYIIYFGDYMSLVNQAQYGSYYADTYGGSYSYDVFVEELDRMIDSLEEEGVDKSAELEMKVWVDKSGEIIGRDVSASNQSGSWQLFRSLRTENDGEYAYELSFGDTQDEYGEYFLLEGNGTERNGLADGNFILETAGQTVGQIEVTGYDTKAAEDGLLNGTFKMTSDADPSLYGYGLEITISSEEDSVTESISVLSNDVAIATLNLENRADSDYTPSLPGDAEIYNMMDEDDMMKYEQSMDVQRLEENLGSNSFLAMLLYGNAGW